MPVDHRSQNPFVSSNRVPFVSGAPQEEALSRLEYRHAHGAGWCVLSGPGGIGKSALLAEVARRAARHGECCSRVSVGSGADEVMQSVAESWNIHLAGSANHEIRRLLEDHIRGMAALRQPGWLLLDLIDDASPEVLRCCRWLSSVAAHAEFALTVVVAAREESESKSRFGDADLHLELWPWDEADCRCYVDQCLAGSNEISPSFTTEAVAALHERTVGVPGRVAKLCEWTWVAAQTESESGIDADLIHAVADELNFHSPRPSTYEVSAAYGAW